MVDECEEEEIEENDLDCEGELGDMDVETPPWNFYGDEDIDCDEEIDDQEDTALLRASAAKTEIVITPMSPVSCGEEEKKAKTKLFFIYVFVLSYSISFFFVSTCFWCTFTNVGLCCR